MRSIRLQFGVRSIFAVVTFFSLCLGAWYWWQTTAELRAMLQAIDSASLLEEHEQQLFASLVWHDEKELTEKLRLEFLKGNNKLVVQRVCWRSDFYNQSGERRRVYVLTSFPLGYPRNISTIVVTDHRNRVICWSNARYLGAFHSAKVLVTADAPELSVVVGSQRHRMLGTSRFQLHDYHIEELPFEFDAKAVEDIRRTSELTRLAKELEQLNAEIIRGVATSPNSAK